VKLPSSLRARLVLGLILGTTTILALNGYVIYAGARQRLHAEFDALLVEVLKSNLSTITRSVHPRPDGQRPLTTPFPELAERSEFHLQVWSQRGRTVIKSKHLGADSLPRLARDFEAISYDEIDSTTLSFESLVLPDGTAGRSAALRFLPPPPPAGVRDSEGRRRPNPGEAGTRETEPGGYELVLARDTGALRDTLAALGWLLTIAWASSSAGCAAILAWIVKRGLRPLARLRTKIQSLKASGLGQPIELPDAPAELTPVVDQLNELLVRLQGTFDRERAFTSDVAHELRTPISGLRSTLEVFLSRPRDAAQAREAAERCLGIAIEMQAVVEVLLEMAAAEGAAGDGRRGEIDLSALMQELWDSMDAEASQGRELVCEFDDAPSLTSDPALLRRILSNLLENALIYGDRQTPIRMVALHNEACVAIRMTNKASAAPPDVAEHAFDAFWRADASRSATGRHAGLGLPLCQRVAQRIDAILEANFVDGEFTVTLELRAKDAISASNTSATVAKN